MFRALLYEDCCNDFMVRAFEAGANEEKMYKTLTPAEAVKEFIEVEWEDENVNKSGS